VTQQSVSPAPAKDHVDMRDGWQKQGHKWTPYALTKRGVRGPGGALAVRAHGAISAAHLGGVGPQGLPTTSDAGASDCMLQARPHAVDGDAGAADGRAAGVGGLWWWWASIAKEDPSPKPEGGSKATCKLRTRRRDVQ
jgi:hypothetical protein